MPIPTLKLACSLVSEMSSRKIVLSGRRRQRGAAQRGAEKKDAVVRRSRVETASTHTTAGGSKSQARKKAERKTKAEAESSQKANPQCVNLFFFFVPLLCQATKHAVGISLSVVLSYGGEKMDGKKARGLTGD